MNAAFVEYGTLVDNAAPIGTVALSGIHALQLPQLEVAAESETPSVYAWVEGRVHAAPHQILAYLCNYALQPVAEQPKGYFKDIEVEEGGWGAGTIYHATIALNGIILNRLVAVSEPERNKLVETDIYTGMRTTFSVRERFGETYLRISTEIPAEPLNTSFPSAALIRRINLAELVMTQRYFA